MLARFDRARIHTIGIASLLLFAGVIMVRCGTAVSNVVSLHHRMVVDAGCEVRKLSPSLLKAAAKDSVLAEVGGSVADPFRTGASRPATARPARPRPAQPTYTLSLNGLLFADRDPVVQLGYGPETSEWLHVGESFRKWTVIEITQRNVTLRKGGRTKVLD